MSIDNPEWYALVVRPRSEKAVAQALANRGVERYLPAYRGRYRSAGRFQDVDLPLFPQYVFCRIGPWSRAHVLSTPGVFRFVAFGNKLAPVNDSELESVRRVVASGMDIQPWPFLKVGDMVEIAEGPFCGLEGRLLTAKGDCKLILDISLLQRSVALTIDRRCVRPRRMTPVSVLAKSRCTVAVA
jgi:transcription antitermination factor NusG